MVETYQQIGIQIKVNGIDPETYFDVIGNPANTNDLLWAGWIPDWANGSAVIPPLFDGRLIPAKANATNNQNYALLNDPEINNDITAALEESVPSGSSCSGASSTRRSRAGPSPSRSST